MDFLSSLAKKVITPKNEIKPDKLPGYITYGSQFVELEEESFNQEIELPSHISNREDLAQSSESISIEEFQESPISKSPNTQQDNSQFTTRENPKSTNQHYKDFNELNISSKQDSLFTPLKPYTQEIKPQSSIGNAASIQKDSLNLPAKTQSNKSLEEKEDYSTKNIVSKPRLKNDKPQPEKNEVNSINQSPSQSQTPPKRNTTQRSKPFYKHESNSNIDKQEVQINVEIGKINLHSAQEKKSSPQYTRKAPHSPFLTLDNYIQQRKRGER